MNPPPMWTVIDEMHWSPELTAAFSTLATLRSISDVDAVVLAAAEQRVKQLTETREAMVMAGCQGSAACSAMQPDLVCSGIPTSPAVDHPSWYSLSCELPGELTSSQCFGAPPQMPGCRGMPASPAGFGNAQSAWPAPAFNPLAGMAAASRPAVGTLDNWLLFFEWPVDINKKELSGSSKLAWSPTFKLAVGDQLREFKMSMHAVKTSDEKGGESFGKARGRFGLKLKCQGQVPEGTSLRFFLSIATTSPGLSAPPLQRSLPMTYDFTKNQATCPDEWDWNPALWDEQRMRRAETFSIYVLVLPSEA